MTRKQWTIFGGLIALVAICLIFVPSHLTRVETPIGRVNETTTRRPNVVTRTVTLGAIASATIPSALTTNSPSLSVPTIVRTLTVTHELDNTVTMTVIPHPTIEPSASPDPLPSSVPTGNQIGAPADATPWVTISICLAAVLATVCAIVFYRYQSKKKEVVPLANIKKLDGAPALMAPVYLSRKDEDPSRYPSYAEIPNRYSTGEIGHYSAVYLGQNDDYTYSKDLTGELTHHDSISNRPSVDYSVDLARHASMPTHYPQYHSQFDQEEQRYSLPLNRAPLNWHKNSDSVETIKDIFPTRQMLTIQTNDNHRRIEAADIEVPESELSQVGILESGSSVAVHSPLSTLSESLAESCNSLKNSSQSPIEASLELKQDSFTMQAPLPRGPSRNPLHQHRPSVQSRLSIVSSIFHANDDQMVSPVIAVSPQQGWSTSDTNENSDSKPSNHGSMENNDTQETNQKSIENSHSKSSNDSIQRNFQFDFPRYSAYYSDASFSTLMRDLSSDQEEALPSHPQVSLSRQNTIKASKHQPQQSSIGDLSISTDGILSSVSNDTHVDQYRADRSYE